MNQKAQTVNKAQQQVRPEPYFPEFLKSRALDIRNSDSTQEEKEYVFFPLL